MEQGSQGQRQPLDPGEMARMLAESIVEDPRVPVNEVWFETEEGRTVLRIDDEPEPAVTIARADLAWLLSCAIDHADHPQYKRAYAEFEKAVARGE